MYNLIDAGTPLEARRKRGVSLGKHFYLTQEENSLLSNKLFEYDDNSQADRCIFKLEETGSEWEPQELQYLLELLGSIKDNELATSAMDKINKYL